METLKPYTLSDTMGVFLAEGFRKLPHALRAARKRARAWQRAIHVSDRVTTWVVRPNLQITRLPPKV